jgi:hypothetical protein
MNYEMIERVAKGTDRRKFLAKAGAASLGAMAGLLGNSQAAEALWYHHGCHLCVAPNQCPSNVNCYWCWQGNCTTDGGSTSAHKHACCEGFKPGTCAKTCDGSWACSVLGTRYAC